MLQLLIKIKIKSQVFQQWDFRAWCNIALYALFTGVRFSNHEIIKIGSSASITCSSDLGVTSTEWLYNGQVIESAEGAEAVLVIESVSDVLHDREYTCRARSRFGIEERSIRILVKGQSLD